MGILADIMTEAAKPREAPRFIARWGRGFRQYRKIYRSETTQGKAKFNRYWRVMADDDLEAIADINRRMKLLADEMRRAETNAWRNGRIFTRDEFEALKREE